MHRFFLPLPFIAVGLAAQPVPHTTTIPEVATGSFLGSASSFPLGRTGGRAQYWFRGDQIPIGMTVVAIGPRPAANQSSTGRNQVLEVTMSNTSLPHSGFTSSFANNLGPTATVVFAQRQVAIPAFSTHQDFDAPGVWIPLDVPFTIIGPNLVVDFDLGTAVGAVSAPYNGDLVTLSGTGRHWTSDPSCGGTLTATSTTTDVTYSMAGGTPNAPAFLMLSTTSTHVSGIPLPFRLDAFGMPNCLLSVDPQIVIPGTANASGSMSMNFPLSVPVPAQVIYGQAAHSSSAVPAGIATTNATRSILGSAGFCAYIYNFTVDGPNAQNGPNQWQGAILFQ